MAQGSCVPLILAQCSILKQNKVVQKGKRNILIGCSGWSYKHWKGRFYPENLPQKKWFDFYAQSFDTVEINFTFYRLPPEKTFLDWAEKAKDGFIYTVKASRYLTHVRRLKDAQESADLLLKRVRLLKEHLGPILYQLPPNWGCDVARLRSFVILLPKDLLHVFEFRDQSWLNDEIFELLEERGISHCIHDKPGLKVPRRTTGPIIYMRFHGATDHRGNYQDDALDKWAEWLGSESKKTHRDIYAYFNNDFEGYAVLNAKGLRDRLMQ